MPILAEPEGVCVSIKDIDDYTLQVSIGGWDNVVNGFTWGVNNYEDEYSDCYINMTWTTSEVQIGSGPISGSVKATNIDTKSNKITLSFNNAKFQCYHTNCCKWNNNYAYRWHVGG